LLYLLVYTKPRFCVCDCQKSDTIFTVINISSFLDGKHRLIWQQYSLAAEIKG